MSIAQWADAARRDKYHQDAEHQRAIDTLQTLLEGKTDADSAATTIGSIYEPLLKRDLKPSPVATLWGILCDAARALCGDREIAVRQVGILNSISKLPDVTDQHGKVITPAWSSAGVYWRDLPELAMMFREYAMGKSRTFCCDDTQNTVFLYLVTDCHACGAIDIEPMDEMEEGGDWDAQAVPLLNATTFGATYLALGRQPIGMAFHAEVSLMQAIEVPCQTPEQQRRAAMYVPPAATWVLFAGESIHKLCEIDHDRKDGAPGSTPNGDEWLWGKGRGYSLERWAFWKKRFGSIAATEDLKDSVRDIATRAKSVMESIEG